MAESKDRYSRLAKATQVFTPNAPIDSLALLSGRFEQMVDVLNAIGQKGQHVALYGERGVGKTSIANILAEAVAQRPNVTRPVSVGVGCTTTDTFETVWRELFRQLGIEYGPATIRPAGIREALAGLEHQTLIALDEFDRLLDDEAISLISDTIKTLSDRPVNATVLLVGVADSIDQLVGDHKSIQRALRQVHIPRMSTRELEGIVGKGLEYLSMTTDPAIKTRIAELSEGLPHYTHALAMYATERAISDDKDDITQSDIDSAIRAVVQKAQHTTLAAYNKATRSAREDALFAPVLLACALAKKDALGLFPARAVMRPLKAITGKDYDIPAFSKHLKKFSGDSKIAGVHGVLQRHGDKRHYFYRFDDPMMQPFVILNGLSNGLISEDVLSAIRSPP